VLRLAILAVAVTAGCGSGEAAPEPGAVRDCLEQGGGVDLSSAVDAIAENAEAAFAVRFPGNEAMIVFERTSRDAENTQATYQAFGGTTDRVGNVVIAWTKAPSRPEEEAVTACLP
jgi:hypothetical protein